jgi:hypothetical protein
MDKSTTIETNAVEVQAVEVPAAGSASRRNSGQKVTRDLQRRKSENPLDRKIARKTKRPGLGLSPGTFVDQPSPKCCSTPI